METLLLVAIVLIALAIVAQAAVLIAMYMMSRRIATKAEALMDDLSETGKIAHEEVLHVQGMVSEARAVVMRPVREYAAVSAGIAAFVSTFFGRKRTATLEEDRPAA